MVGTGVGSNGVGITSPLSCPNLLQGASLCATMAKFGQFHFPSSTAARFHLGITMQIAVPRVLNLSDSRNLLLCVSQPSLPLHVVLSGVTHSNRPPLPPYRHLYGDQERAGEERKCEMGTIHK